MIDSVSNQHFSGALQLEKPWRRSKSFPENLIDNCLTHFCEVVFVSGLLSLPVISLETDESICDVCISSLKPKRMPF